MSASTDFDVSVFNPEQATRVQSFNTGAAMSAVATVGVRVRDVRECDDMIFAGGKDYVIHCYSLNTPRFYQAMEQQCMLMHTQPNPAAYDVGACGGSDA